jgi:predicted RNA binding protein YcfA (HicA-like mRNA interferase family)
LPRIPGINHQAAIRAFEKAGFKIVRQSGHVVMRKDQTILVIPRGDPIKPYTMGDLVKVAGLSVEEFKKFLKGEPERIFVEWIA